VAVAETRHAARAVPGVVRHLVPIVAWAVAAITLGLIVGFAAVVLPPIGSFGIVALVGLVLLWVMPDLPLVWPGLIRKTFFVMLTVDLSVPYYYTVEFSGLPWISARRLATFLLIVPFVLAIAASSDVRRQITDRFRPSLLIFVCAIGYLVMAALSLLTSMLPTETISALVDAVLSWYLPFFAMVYIIRDKDDVIFILKILCICALFNTAAGLLEFRLQHRFFLDVFPRGMLENLIQNNPVLQVLLPSPEDFRNGLYRARSTFITPLAFGEFEIIVIPIALFFALHRENWLEKSLGWAVVIGGPVGIFCSGSRGGWVGFLASMAVFVCIWTIRKATNHKESLAPAVVGLTSVLLFAVVIGLIAVWPRAHNMVLGGGQQAGSTEARYEQWLAALPFIKSNPITGHGFPLGGYIIQSSIDSYIISLLIETGIPGLVFFAGVVLLPVWYGLRNYFADMSETGAVAGALACSFVAFTAYRLALSQRENHMLIFSLLGIVVVLNYEYVRKRVTKRLGEKPPQKAYLRAEAS
jgi:O-antigen ligase